MKRLALLLALALPVLTSLPAQEVQPTVIVSEQLDMSSTDTLTTFIFTKDVVVTGTNLKLTCDRLTVVTTRKGDITATLGKHGRFKSLIAEGHVDILQSDREAACGRAEVLPDDDKIILTDNPVVKDLANGAIATGPRMELYTGQRRAVIEGLENAPSKIFLPPIKNLGFDKEKDKEAKPAAPDTPAASAAEKPKQP